MKNPVNPVQNLLFFLLALTNHFGLSRLFTFSRRRRDNLFLHNADSGNHELGIRQYLDRLAHRNIRNVQHVMNIEVGDIDLERVGNLTRLTANLDLANDLFEHTLLLPDTERLTVEMKRYGHFDLLTLNYPCQVA